MRAVAPAGAIYKNSLFVVDEAVLLLAFTQVDEAGVFSGSSVFLLVGNAW